MDGVRVFMTSVLALMLVVSAHAQDRYGQEYPDPGQDPDEMSPQARETLQMDAERLRRARLLVTIRARKLPVEQVVEMFRLQTPWNIIFDRTNFPDDYVVEEFVVVNEPSKSAIQEFARVIQAAVEFESPTLVRLHRPPRLTFNFRNASINDVIDMIARVSGANIIVAPDVGGEITMSINNVPWDHVLEAVIKTLGFTMVREDFGILRIIHPDELLKQMETRVFPLLYIQPPSPYTAQVEAGKQIVGAPVVPPTDISSMLESFVLAKVLKTILSVDGGNVTIGKMEFDPQTNVFVVTDTKVVLDRMAEIIKLLDVEPAQVAIDLKFISTSNDDLLTFGTGWNFGAQGGAGYGTSVIRPSTFTTAGGETVTGKISRLPFGFGKEVGTGRDQFFLNTYDMSMTFRAFKQDRYSRLMQAPKLTVIDNEEATIFVGEEISFAATSGIAGELGDVVYTIAEASSSPVKVGFQLFVIPKIIMAANKVIMTVIPENEFLTGQSPDATVAGFERFKLVSNGLEQSIDLPRISTTSLITKLIIESGRTVVLGGLVIERVALEDTGIPILKDLPLVNYFFKQRSDSIRKEHLLIFITPRIIPSGNGASENFSRLIELSEQMEQRDFHRLRKLVK